MNSGHWRNRSDMALRPAQPTSTADSSRRFLRELLFNIALSLQGHRHQAVPFPAGGWQGRGPFSGVQGRSYSGS